MTNETSLQFHGEKRNKLPTGWQTMPLGEVVDILDGRRVPVNAKERETRVGSVPYYGATGQVGWIDDCLFDEELVLLGEDGAPFLEAAKPKAYIVRGKSWVNNHAHVLRARNGLPNAYLKYYLDIVDYHGFVTGTTRLKLTQGAMRQIPVPIAPPDQQKRIVAEIEKQFSRLDEAVANLKRVRANLKRYKAAVLKAAVEGELTEDWRKAHPDVEPASELLKRILAARRGNWNGKGRYKEPGSLGAEGLPSLPHSWLWTTTGELCDCIVPNRDKPKSFSGDIPWITFPDFEESSIDLNRSKSGLGLSREEINRYKARLIPSGSVVMSCVGRFGIAAVCQTPLVINQQLHGFLIPNGLNNRYFTYAIKTQVPYMDSIATATTIRYLNKANCNRVPIPLPPKPEQDQIVMELERRLSINEELASEIDANFKRATRLRESILKMAFSGKLGVHDLNSRSSPHQQDQIQGLSGIVI
jgi:type I restriction enzyme, S subunit